MQAAHEILSDPQERAWYDDHRDSILSGLDEQGNAAEPTTFRNVRLTSTQEILALMRKFTTAMPFDDEPTGFYGIARELFDHLALEEEAAAEYANTASPDLPSFGNSDDSYEAVVKVFYTGWSGFSTGKSFSWKDKYRLSDAPDRRVRRAMEKENKKLREEAAREFSETVRFLVTFVRKRDPRYVPNFQSHDDRQKTMRDAAAKQAARSRRANQENLSSYQTPTWVQERTEYSDEQTTSESSDESQIMPETFECVVCDKIFKSENQFNAHERSKKHMKALAQLRKQLRKEGKELNLTPQIPEHMEEQGRESSVEEHQTNSSQAKEASQSAQRPDQAPIGTAENNLSGERFTESLRSGSQTGKGDHKHLENDAATSDSSMDEWSSGGEYASREQVKDRILTADVHGDEVDESVSGISSLHVRDEERQPGKKIGKAKLKRAKKANAQSRTAEVCRA